MAQFIHISIILSHCFHRIFRTKKIESLRVIQDCYVDRFFFLSGKYSGFFYSDIRKSIDFIQYLLYHSFIHFLIYWKWKRIVISNKKKIYFENFPEKIGKQPLLLPIFFFLHFYLHSKRLLLLLFYHSMIWFEIRFFSRNLSPQYHHIWEISFLKNFLIVTLCQWENMCVLSMQAINGQLFSLSLSLSNDFQL